jgi:hypothetical protein
MQKLKSNKQADERKDKTMKKMHGQMERHKAAIRGDEHF